MKVRWADDPILRRVARIYVSGDADAVEYMFIGEWAGPGVPSRATRNEIKRRLERRPPDELERLLQEGAPLPSVSLSEIERRMQNAYGLHEPTQADLLNAIATASKDVRDLLAVLRGQYRATP